MLELIKNPHIDFMRWRGVAYIVSGIMMVMAVIGIVMVMNGKANMGVDFAGGTSMEIEFANPINTDQIRAAANHEDFQSVSIQTVHGSGKNVFLVRFFAPKLPADQVSNRMMARLNEKIANNPITLRASEDVGPTVSAHLRQQALYAIFWSVVGLLIYIWWRFDFRFAVAATIATFHDVFAVFGIFAMFHWEISWLFITALLTLAGYSINDTIVTFDRIRENLRLRRKDDFYKIVNDSVNETLSRTIITATTVFLVVVALLVLGGEVIYGFALAMFYGCIIGTYSSVWIASGVLVDWNMRDPLQR